MRKIGFALASLLIPALLQGQGGWLGASALAATGDTLIVTGDGVNVRYAPSTDAKVRMRIYRDQLVTERERQGDWVHVEVAGSDGAEGWIYALLLASPTAEQLARAQRRASEPPAAGLPEAKPPAPAGAVNPAAAEPAAPAGAGSPAVAELAGANPIPVEPTPPAPAIKPPAPATKPPAPAVKPPAGTRSTAAPSTGDAANAADTTTDSAAAASSLGEPGIRGAARRGALCGRAGGRPGRGCRRRRPRALS